ncbi:hypothetical protein [uncultured Herbaspirillum sp.]|uniref:hypothetical protein n=1 Tax=uncultured Herbaspirillum sp. TaxID=160236 RepID=UPI00258B0DC7|nr:hypothetical protein [uncultured Herbaspirillum sp.]
MLQISTGKFYESTAAEHLFETVHRGVAYTNYSFLRSSISTKAGNILPATQWGDLNCVICEITERLPKPQGRIVSGTIASVGPDTLIQDFAAIASFGLNATFTANESLAARLVNARSPGLGIAALPKAFIPRMFDEHIPYVQEELDKLVKFVDELMGLERAHYRGAVRAIERYVTAMHRLGDDLSLAYTLLVAAIESLVQGFDDFEPIWNDLDASKRGPIDTALENATEDVSEAVRSAVLSIEHAALGRRFVEFTLNHIQPSFFRSEAIGRIMPVGRSTLIKGLKKAYVLRSKYVHELQPLPRNLLQNPWHADIQLEDATAYLSLAGLSRVTRHVIFEFVRRSRKVDHEKYNYFSDYPNIISLPLAPSEWLYNATVFSTANSHQYLSGLLQQMAGALTSPTTAKVSDMRAVCKKIESLVPSLGKPERKLPMVLIYLLFGYCLPQKEREDMTKFLEPNLALFNEPSIFSLLAHTLTEPSYPDWMFDEGDSLLEEYLQQRLNKTGVDAGPLYGAAISLYLAEMHRITGNEKKARQIISQAVEEYPGLELLREFEIAIENSPLSQINWREILVQSSQNQRKSDANQRNKTIRRSVGKRHQKRQLKLRSGAIRPRK